MNASPLPVFLLATLLAAPALAQPDDGGLAGAPLVSDYATRAPAVERADLSGPWRIADFGELQFGDRRQAERLDTYTVVLPDSSAPVLAEFDGETLTLVSEVEDPAPVPEPRASGALGVLETLRASTWWPFEAPAEPEPLDPRANDVIGTYSLGTQGGQPAFEATRPFVLQPYATETFRSFVKVDVVAEWGRELAAKGKRELLRRTNLHYDEIDRTGIGTHYGDHSSFNGWDATRRAEWIKDTAKPGTTPRTRLRRSSCIGWVLETVGAAYRASGKTERWKEIYRSVTSNGAKGRDLALELEKDGWQAVYWNPDTRKPSDGGGEHTVTARNSRAGRPYYKIKIDPSMMAVDYKPTPGGPTRKDTSGLERLRQVPFWFGMAKGGMHTFVGHNGTLSEFHWSEMPDSKNAIDQKPLEEFSWLSGVIMIPPGTWPAVAQ